MKSGNVLGTMVAKIKTLFGSINGSSIKKHWKEILIVILAILLLWIFFNKNKQLSKLEATNKAVQEQLVLSNQVIQSKDEAYKAKSAEYQKEIDKYDALLQIKNKRLDYVETDLKNKGALVRRLLRDATGQSLVNPDSIDRVVQSKVDSAVAEFDQLAIKYSGMEYLLAEIQELQVQKDSAQSAALRAANAQLDAMRTAYNDVFSKYNLLYKDFQKVSKKVKRKTFLNRVLSAGVLATGTMYLLK